MIVGARIRDRLEAQRLSQSELARRVGLNQSTINGLIAGEQRSSTKLHQIARALSTTPAYLEGEIDDPDVGALPPLPAGPQVVMLGVVLPPERALAAMFEGLLEGIDRGAPVDEQALLLAQRLPIGLSQLRDLLPDEAKAVRAPAAAAPALAMSDPGRRS